MCTFPVVRKLYRDTIGPDRPVRSVAVRKIYRTHVHTHPLIYINKEELKTVVRDILACAQPNRHETFTAHWNPYRRVSSRGRRAKIRFSRGARGEKPENDRPPFWFYGESIRTSVHGSQIVLWRCHHRNAIVGTNMKYLCM